MPATFYAKLPAHDCFVDIANPAVYTPVPPCWHVIITDVTGSTEAVQAGRYKAVNIIGAASIIALLNLDRDLDVPYVFGGDGASLVIPPSLLEQACAALLATQSLARQEFDLDLRVGIVPVADILAAGQRLLIAKFKLSASYEQAMFSGGGLAFAERLVKDPATALQYAVSPTSATPQADFTGLECRWQDIPSPYGETVTLLVTATAPTTADNNAIYRDVIERIEAVYGDPEQYRPLTHSTLKPSFSPAQLLPESKVRQPGGFWKHQRHLWKIWARNHLLRLFLKFDVQTGTTHWRDYMDLLIHTSDYRKYDDTLRMILAGTPGQRETLTAYLKGQYQAGKLSYGLHVADRALMTCVVFERMGRQAHFIDGADGGYALAAKALKKRISATAPLASTP